MFVLVEKRQQAGLHERIKLGQDSSAGSCESEKRHNCADRYEYENSLQDRRNKSISFTQQWEGHSWPLCPALGAPLPEASNANAAAAEGVSCGGERSGREAFYPKGENSMGWKGVVAFKS